MTTQPPDDDRTVIRPSASLPGASPSAGQASAPAPARAPAPSPAPDYGTALPVGTQLGEFEITSMLGEGGFGIVYLAWDHSLERKVALKEYMPSALAARSGTTQVSVKSERHRETFEAGRKSFVNEAKLLAQFDHPSLVKVYRFWEANGTAYMVMPFYEGITLKDRLKEMGSPPDEAWLMGLLAPLTEALAVIHAESCYHRDIAPDNVILLGASGKPLLLDFGAARRVIGDMTQALTVILKPGYAPVEQYAEAPGMKQGPWTDVYALAASVYYAMLGKTPPPSVSRLMSDHYVPLVESCAGRYSPRFLAAIDNALRVRPEDRTQTIDDLRHDLGLSAAQVQSQETQIRGASDPLAGASLSGGSARGSNSRPSSTAPGMAPAAAPSRTGLYAGIGLAALALVGGGAWFALGSSKPPTPPAPKPDLTATAPAPSPTVQLPPVTAPAPAPAPVAPAPAPADFDPRSEFDRVLALQTSGFQVEATSPKSQLRINKDNLAFTVKSNREGWVTVLVFGPDGSLMRLFPNRESPKIRIKAGQSLRLPPGDVAIATGEPAGAEHFLVIVSNAERSFDALSPTDEDGYLRLPTGSAATQRLASRGTTTPALLGDARACSGEHCDDFGAARFTLEVVK